MNFIKFWVSVLLCAGLSAGYVYTMKMAYNTGYIDGLIQSPIAGQKKGHQF